MGANRVLIVESDPTISRMMADFFTERGAQVETCVNGREAFRLAMVEDYDLVTVNVKVPEMDGCLVLESITMVKPTTRIILVSAAFDSEANIKAALEKAAGKVQLPLNTQELVSLVEPFGF